MVENLSKKSHIINFDFNFRAKIEKLDIFDNFCTLWTIETTQWLKITKKVSFHQKRPATTSISIFAPKLKSETFLVIFAHCGA